MRVLRQNIFVNLGITGLLLILLIPSFVGLNHVFDNDQHVICADASESHFHEIDHECDFKLKLNTSFVFVFNSYEINTIQNPQKAVVQKYAVHSVFQPTFFQLRAPPALV